MQPGAESLSTDNMDVWRQERVATILDNHVEENYRPLSNPVTFVDTNHFPVRPLPSPSSPPSNSTPYQRLPTLMPTELRPMFAVSSNYDRLARRRRRSSTSCCGSGVSIMACQYSKREPGCGLRLRLSGITCEIQRLLYLGSLRASLPHCPLVLGVGGISSQPSRNSPNAIRLPPWSGDAIEGAGVVFGVCSLIE